MVPRDVAGDAPDAREELPAVEDAVPSIVPPQTMGVEPRPAPVRSRAPSERPSPAERERRVAELVERIGPHLSRSSADLEVERRPDGTGRISLRGRFQHASVARVAADGTLQHECVDSPQALRDALERGR